MVQEHDNNNQLEKLENLHKNATTRPCGHTLKYRGYTLEKVDWNHPDHTEYNIKNRDNRTVESYMITAFDTPRKLKQQLDKLINRNPSTIKEAIKGGQK